MRKKTKFFLLRVSVILSFAILAGRVWDMQIVEGRHYQQQADYSKIRLVPVPALRGIIYDRTGTHPLVYNVPSWSITIVPHGIPQLGAGRIYHMLSQLLHGQPSAQKIAQMVQNHEWQAYAPFVVKARVSTDTALIVKQLHSRLPGVQAQPSSVRQYMLDSELSLAHILGYTGVIDTQEYLADSQAYPGEHVGLTDTVGREGIEQVMDPYLHGVNGTAEVEVDAGERPVRVLSPGHAIPGDSVNLTIDWQLQQEVASDLGAALHKLNLRQGVAVVENVHNGQILAMVSLPSYDDNWFSGGISQAKYDTLLNDPAHPLDDMATQGQFPPGSTFKIITAAAALQTGVVNQDTIINDTGEISLPDGRNFFGWTPPPGLGPMNIVSAISHSSDIYFYTVTGGNPVTGWGPGMGSDRLARWAHLLGLGQSYSQVSGLGQSAGFELPDSPGFIPSASWYNHLPANSKDPLRPDPSYTWHIGDNYNMAIGQGYDLATPLQMVNVAATIANGGTLYQPRIVKSIVGRVEPRRGVLKQTQVIQPFVPTIIRRNFIDPGNIALIQEGMHESVDLPAWQGTSYLTQDKRIDAAGKTGTAESGQNPDGSFKPPHAWWVGYAPFNNPQIAVVVMVPYADAEGAYVSAPIAHKIFEDYFHLKPQLPDKPGDINWLDDVTQQLVGSGGGSQ